MPYVGLSSRAGLHSDKYCDACLSSGEQLGHYKIESLIGKGGMDEVKPAIREKCLKSCKNRLATSGPSSARCGSVGIALPQNHGQPNEKDVDRQREVIGKIDGCFPREHFTGNNEPDWTVLLQ